MTSLKIWLPNVRPIFVVSIYRPPSGLTDNFKTHISNMLNDIVQTRKFDIYIGGDFNIDYKKNNPHKKLLKELEVEYGLTQPLYSDTIVDLIFTNNKDFSHPGTINYNGSDHLPTFIIRKKIKAKQITTEFIGRTYKNYSKEILTEKLLASNWEEQFQLQNPNLAWDFFH